MTDNSRYASLHNKVIDYIKRQTGIDLNDYRDGNGTDPFTTTYWDLNGQAVCVNWNGSEGGMNRNTQNAITRCVNNSNGKLRMERGGAWFKYIWWEGD